MSEVKKFKISKVDFSYTSDLLSLYLSASLQTIIYELCGFVTLYNQIIKKMQR